MYIQKYQNLWQKYHSRALLADKKILPVYYFNQELYELPRKLPCQKCSVHLKEYLVDYPPEKYDDKFKYMFDLHNAVNSVTQKPIMDYESCKKLFNYDL